MTKFKLAMFGHYSWTDLWSIPLFLFYKGGLYSYTYIKDITAQWVYPHVTPLAYLRYHRTVFKHGASVFELYTNPPSEIYIDPRETS